MSGPDHEIRAEMGVFHREPSMKFQREINAKIVIADQPDEMDLAALHGKGFDGLVNLRNDGEPEQPIGTKEEGELARHFDVDYLHYGVGGGPLDREGVEAVCDFLDQHSKVLVHCRKGGRAAALVLIQQARANGWSASEVAARGKEIGLEVDGGLRTLVETYLEQHPPAGSKRAGGA